MFEALLAAVCITLIALVGALFFHNDTHADERMHRYILPIAVGVFLGVVFFELIPETLEASHTFGPIAILVGFLGFYLLSHFLDTYHHHHTDSHDDCAHNGARMLLIGDGIHNFADGVVIASAFILNPVAGVMTAIGIALHEIPQEIAEFGVLLRAGYSKGKACLYNMLSASSVILGVLLTYFFIHTFADIVFVLTGIAAGNLLYIATADFIPELRHSHKNHFVQTFAATLFGVVCIGVLITYTHSL